MNIAVNVVSVRHAPVHDDVQSRRKVKAAKTFGSESTVRLDITMFGTYCKAFVLP